MSSVHVVATVTKETIIIVQKITLSTLKLMVKF